MAKSTAAIIITYLRTRWMASEIEAITGIPRNSIVSRIKYGWTVEQAVTIPTAKQRKQGVTPQTITEAFERAKVQVDREGVVSNFASRLGTGAGSTAQEIPNITFSGDA